jgi:hypothetical protein
LVVGSGRSVAGDRCPKSSTSLCVRISLRIRGETHRTAAAFSCASHQSQRQCRRNRPRDGVLSRKQRPRRRAVARARDRGSCSRGTNGAGLRERTCPTRSGGDLLFQSEAAQLQHTIHLCSFALSALCADAPTSPRVWLARSPAGAPLLCQAAGASLCQSRSSYPRSTGLGQVLFYSRTWRDFVWTVYPSWVTGAFGTLLSVLALWSMRAVLTVRSRQFGTAWERLKTYFATHSAPNPTRE